MQTLLIALGAGVAFLIAYHTYGRWLGQKIFNLSADFVCPSHRLNDGKDYVPSPKAIVFGHHFTSIAGTGPIVGPAIAVMWGWLPALLWVVFGSIFIGAVHDFGALVVSLRNNGQTVGDIAGRLLNKRVRLLFLFVLFMALTIVLAIFGLVIAAVFRQYPASIFPCVVQIPIAVGIGLYLHRKGKNLTIPSLIALALMYLTVAFGDQHTPIAELSWLPGWLSGGIGAVESALHTFNATLAGWSIMTWVVVLLLYCYLASVLPVWVLLQPRDYINSLQLLTALGLVVVGLLVAAMIGGAPPVQGAARQPLEIVAPAWNFHPAEAPMIFPFLFITVACGAISGFHCLVSSGTSSKQLEREPDARFVGYGAMLTEGFLATIVILACVAGLGLGSELEWGSSWIVSTMQADIITPDGTPATFAAVSGPVGPNIETPADETLVIIEHDDEFLFKGNTDASMVIPQYGVAINVAAMEASLISKTAFNTRYQSWKASGGLARTVGAFVDGSANFLKSMGIPGGIAVALMGVLVASFAGTTLDTACRLQRYVVQELAATFLPAPGPRDCVECGYDLTANVSGKCPECGWEIDPQQFASRDVPIAESDGVHSRPVVGGVRPGDRPARGGLSLNPLVWLQNKHGATLFAISVAALMAAMPPAGGEWTWAGAGKGGMILWPMFGATNQLLGGLAFLVIGFYLWRRSKPVWFLVLPMLFMLIMPAWAMTWQLFIGSDDQPAWLYSDSPNWALIVIAAATLVLEVWMVIEAVLLWPRVKGVLEPQLASAPGAGGVGAGK